MRPPSAGFVYLAAVAAASAGFFAYLLREPWWERYDRDADLAAAAYLQRIAGAGPAPMRAPWLRRALDLLVRSQAWADAAVLVADQPDRLAQLGVTAVIDGACWSIRSGDAVLVLLRNTDPAPRRVSLHWRADAAGAATLRDGDGSTPLPLAGDPPTGSVAVALPARVCRGVWVTGPAGLELEGAEVTP